MDEFMSNRNEFIEKHNSYKLYNFTKLSDDIVREFFPMLQIIEHLCHGNISDEIIDEFRTSIEERVGGRQSLENIIFLRRVLNKYFHIIPTFEANENNLGDSISFQFTTGVNEFKIRANPSVVFILNFRKISIIKKLTEDTIIGEINRIIFVANANKI